MAGSRVAVVAYNGIDGACAAAMALLRHPRARVVVTSAGRIGEALEALKGQALREVHICGLGARCDWEEVARPLRAMRAAGVTVFWYCGRGYLDERREAYQEVCTPVFEQLRTNTEAICRHLELEGHPTARALMRLALLDPNLGRRQRRTPSEAERFWTDLINASIAQYFKYQDEDAYAATVRKLARQEYEEGDVRAVEVFRRTGFQYVLLGRSQAMRRLRRTIRACARVDEPVLITGESGVGKEYVAHLIHEGSERAMGAFVPVNCAVFAGNGGLANSVLFGHLKGSFTGALRDRDGAFAAAHGGILFLDEVGELPPEVQAKFLRVLEDGWITPEGADAPTRKVSVRVLAATSRDLPAMLRRGEFRPDLFHRLGALRLRVPPLREHLEDLETIAEATLRSLAAEGYERVLTEADYRHLSAYDWPGNVRQLIKMLKRAVYMDMPIVQAVAAERKLGGLSPSEAADLSQDPFLPRTLEEIVPLKEARRRYAERALELNGGNYAATARRLGIAVNTLRSYLKGG